MSNTKKHFKKYLLLAFTAFLFSCEPKTDTPTPTTSSGRDDNMALGNPSSASNSISNSENYLMVKPQFVLSYNKKLSTANWVSWHLNSAWKGTAQRKDDFKADPDLPSAWDAVGSSDYSGSGFDRGHICPSDDRDGSQTDNSATFLMTNMLPQAPKNNRETWRILEEYCRSLVDKNNELYIVAGGYGTGGSGSNGGTTKTIDGRINVPARVWKVILVIPNGGNDINRITNSTRIIAVDMPNKESVTDKKWYEYRVSVDDIEAKTGYNFYNILSTSIQNTIESKVDTEKIE